MTLRIFHGLIGVFSCSNWSNVSSGKDTFSKKELMLEEETGGIESSLFKLYKSLLYLAKESTICWEQLGAEI